MANPELELISNVLKSGDFATVKKRGITPEFFQTDEASEYFRWIWDQYNNPKTRGEVPSVDKMRRKFPDFDYCPSRDSVESLITEISSNTLSQELDQFSSEIQDLVLSNEDPGFVLNVAQSKIRDLSAKNTEHSGTFMKDAFSALKQEYETVQTAGGVTGITYPWEPLNRATGGMHPEEFIVFYGRPKNCKSWCGLVTAVNAYLENNARVYIFSKEMRTEDLIRRCASLITKLDYEKVKTGTLSKDDLETFFDTLEFLKEWEEDTQVDGHRRALYFDSDKGKSKASTVDDISARAEKFEPDIVVIDGFYLMRDGRSQTRTADWKNIAHISQDLKGMAQYLEVPLIGITQANRANSAAPSNDFDDLSYADAIGQDADLAMRVFLGKNPQGPGMAIAMYFSGIREAVLRPFLIRAYPGVDFSVLQDTVNMKEFLKEKAKMDREEDDADASSKPSGKGKKKPPKSPFRA